MEKYGIRGKGNEWFQSYLGERKMRVKCVGGDTKDLCYSNYSNISYGVPQGSCLEPLLFLIFCNDLPLILQSCKSILFADDTTIYLQSQESMILDNGVSKKS